MLQPAWLVFVLVVRVDSDQTANQQINGEAEGTGSIEEVGRAHNCTVAWVLTDARAANTLENPMVKRILRSITPPYPEHAAVPANPLC